MVRLPPLGMYKEVPGLLDPQDLWDVFMFSETLEFINGAPSPDFLKTTRFFFFFFFFASLRGLWNLSSQTRDRAQAHWSESAESSPLDRQGIPLLGFESIGFTFHGSHFVLCMSSLFQSCLLTSDHRPHLGHLPPSPGASGMPGGKERCSFPWPHLKCGCRTVFSFCSAMRRSYKG